MSARAGGAAMAVTCVPAFMVGLDNLVVVTTLPSIRADLNASVEQLGWTVNVYILAVGVLMLCGAALGDRLGRRRVFTAGLLLFAGASAGAALAPEIGWLIAARALQGAGAALVMPMSLALVSDASPAGARGAAIGVWSMTIGAAVAIGPVVGGIVADGLSWHWIFWINVPIGLAAAALAPRVLPATRGTARRVDLGGLALATGGLLGIVWGLLHGNEQGWDSAGVVAPLAGGVALLVAFVAWQRRAAEPLLPAAVLRDRSVLAANGAGLLCSTAIFGAAFVVPQLLQSARGASPLEAGLQMLPWTGITLVVTPLAGMLADRLGNRPFIVAGLVLQGGAFVWLALVAGPDASYVELVAPLLVAGSGISMVFPTVANAAVGALRGEDLNVASAANGSFREIGGVMGIAFAAAMFAAAGGYGSAQEISDGVTGALVVAAVASLLGALVGAGVTAGDRQPRPAPAPADNAHVLASERS